jgi:hypothetical protein
MFLKLFSGKPNTNRRLFSTKQVENRSRRRLLGKANGGRQMDKKLIGQLLAIAKEVAPEIEAALSDVKDSRLRATIAAAIMQRVLTLSPASRGERLGEATYPAARADARGEVGRASGTQGRILDLRSDSFFAEPRRLEQVLEELQIKGYHHNKSDVRMGLLRLARKKLLRRIPYGTGKQETFLYVEP